MKRKKVYDSPKTNVIEMNYESAICSASPAGKGSKGPYGNGGQFTW